jgi:glycosyl-4,4'-diaponeurosporenoate acyltransferase
MAWFVRVFPKSLFDPANWFFKEKYFERKLYKKMNVASWKDKLPEWGKLLNFEKKSLNKEITLEYIDQFLLETCYAEAGHIGMAVAGFACILVNSSTNFIMALTFAIVNVCIQIPFILIQRYNRPRLLRLRFKYISK